MPSTSTEPPSRAMPHRSQRAGTANELATIATTMLLVKRQKRDQNDGPVAEMLSLKLAWTRIPTTTILHSDPTKRNRSCKKLVRRLASMKTTLSRPSKTQRGKRSHRREQARFCKTKLTRTADETRINPRRARTLSHSSSDNRRLTINSKARSNSLIPSTLIGSKSRPILLAWRRRRRKERPRKRARSVKPIPTRSQSRARPLRS